ncbi:MAG: hypothetical protein BAJATHORv1_10152 [Candidatus Thorarchaeota archaeon]|nr:MAG: hypothetical protein BAJATHORv1_10152 [Candidatus Thorarchaeota archaeon]
MNDEMASDVRMCAACPKMCRHVCPTFFAWRSDAPTPHGRALLLHQEIKGVRELDERAIQVLYQCLECSHCLTWCKPEIDIASIVESRRTELAEEGRQPTAIKDLVSIVRSNHNPFDEPHSKRLEKLELPTSKNPDIVYFTGCTSAYQEEEIANSTINVLSRLGFKVALLEDEWCCASPLFRTGSLEAALEQANHNVEILNAHSAEKIVVSCPGCLRALTIDYPKHGLEITKPIYHISQFLDMHRDGLGETDPSIQVTYHDPCHLGRHCNVYDEPRRVIESISGIPPSEMERNRENAMCCGNGAGLRLMYPDASKKIGRERIEQALRTGSKLLLSTCPFCKNLLKQQAGDEIEVLDLVEFVDKYTKDVN